MTSSLSKRNHRYAVTPEWILFHPDLGAASIRVFGALDRFLGTNESAWPSHKTIAAVTALSIASVKRAIKELRQVGALHTVPRKREDGSLTSLDYYLWPKSAEMGAIVTYGEGNYALRGDKNLTYGGVDSDLGVGSDLTYGGVDSDLTRRSINEGTPKTEPQRSKTPPTASADVLGLVALLDSRLDQNGLKEYPHTQAQFRGFASLLKENDLEDVTDRLEWATTHVFWRNVILTPLTFKKNYATIDAQFKNDKLTKIRDWVESPEEESAW